VEDANGKSNGKLVQVANINEKKRCSVFHWKSWEREKQKKEGRKACSVGLLYGNSRTKKKNQGRKEKQDQRMSGARTLLTAVKSINRTSLTGCATKKKRRFHYMQKGGMRPRDVQSAFDRRERSSYDLFDGGKGAPVAAKSTCQAGTIFLNGGDQRGWKETGARMQLSTREPSMNGTGPQKP